MLDCEPPIGFRRLVRAQQTKEYYKRDGSLTPNAREAFQFPTLRAAYDFCQQNHLNRAAVVLKHPNPMFDVELPPINEKLPSSESFIVPPKS